MYSPEIARQAKPGQFVMIYLNDSERLLPRPISICDADKTNCTVTLIYAVVGTGTKIISNWPAGKDVQIMGPLGNGFDLANIKSATLVGGGLGAPPMVFLQKELARMSIQARVCLGFRQKNAIADYFTNPYIATDDGSQGHMGTVLDILPDLKSPIYACGPRPMLKALAQHAATRGIPCFVSMEAHMACGVGACKGCVVKTTNSYWLCCSWGPVFDAKDIDWLS